jgi:glucokinase
MTFGATVVSLEAAKRPIFLGVDIGGTTIKLGVVDDLGRSIATDTLDTIGDRPADDAMRRTHATACELLSRINLSWSDISAIGLGSPGTMDIPSGKILNPVNIPGWHNFNIRDFLGELAGKRVAFANDANAAAYGEYWVGGGAAYHSMVLLTLGTGVGGGIIIGDLSIDGEHSMGSECGHIVVDSTPTARRCSCGRIGHLEAYCSATSLVARAKELAEIDKFPAAKALPAITAKDIAALAESGDLIAYELVLETARWLGIGLSILVATVDPTAILIGGAMTFGRSDSALGRAFLERAKGEMNARIFRELEGLIVVDYAHLGPDAGYIGAAGLARKLHQSTSSPF